RILEFGDLSARLHTPVSDLAHGSRQWLEMAMVATARPRLLLLDEPAAGLGIVETARLAEVVAGLRRMCAVMVVEHDMAFVRALAARTAVLHQGRIIRDGSFEAIERDAEIRDIYLGRERADAYA